MLRLGRECIALEVNGVREHVVHNAEGLVQQLSKRIQTTKGGKYRRSCTILLI